MLQDWLARHLPRWLAIALAIRRVTPRGAWDAPRASYQVEVAADTGGAYRAPWRPQDPSKDPREPGGGESSSAGTDHGWSNCTMAAGAMALAYQRAPSQGSLTPWGGDLRHGGQPDLSGGTDLYDVQDAWREYGEDLSIRSGQGWAEVKDCHAEGRAIIAQGQGNVPGSEAFDGGHGCAIAPETHSDGRWLFGDPLANGWQWVSASSIRTWMEAWSGSCSFAVGELPPATPPPQPPPPDTTPYGPSDLSRAEANGYQAGLDDGRQAGGAEALDAVFRSWTPGQPRTALAPWEATAWDAGAWGQVPYPLEGLAGARTPSAWGTHPTAWTGALWRDVTPAPGELTPWGGGAWSAPWS